jgi:hypothetical protein
MKMQTIALPDGREIEIPRGHVCIAMDGDGEWWSYDSVPHARMISWLVAEDGDCGLVEGLLGPFGPGHWTTQIYWIEG